jgi:hypothetical protein
MERQGLVIVACEGKVRGVWRGSVSVALNDRVRGVGEGHGQFGQFERIGSEHIEGQAQRCMEAQMHEGQGYTVDDCRE